MNFTAKTVPYQKTGFFSTIITDYLEGRDFVKNFYEHPVSYQGLEAAMHARENFQTDRVSLVKVLTDQYAGLIPQQAVSKNIESLSGKNTFTVTTAHQPAIFTGTLYFIYKILHVVKLAESLTARYPGKYFVPVFYMGSEDADLEELGHIFLDNEKISWDTNQTGAVGRMRTTGLQKIISRIQGEYADHAHGPELIQLLKDCYLGSETIQEATLKLLHQLFGSFGLVVLIPDNRLLKNEMHKVFEDDLNKHSPFEITRIEVQKLATQYPVQANPREINLFYIRDNIRERIDFKEGKYIVHNTNIRFSTEEMEKELNEYPERFSPNVILRGLYQETILPNIAFVGGGGETAYWLELKALFRHYKVPFPVLILRNSFLLIRKKWNAKMEKTGLPFSDFFKSGQQLIEEYIKQHSTRQLSLNKEIVALRSVYESIKNISGVVDKTLEDHVEKLQSQNLKKLNELEKKILRAEKKNHQEVYKRIEDIRNELFPMGNLQERIESFIPWYSDYGREFLELILRHSLTLEQQFVTLEEVG